VLTDSLFTVFARSTLGGAVLLASAVVTSAAMLAWISRTHRKDRRQAATAAVSFHLDHPAERSPRQEGVWQSTLYTLPPLALVSTTVLFLEVGTALMILILWGYRQPAAHSRHAPLIYGLLLLVVFAPLIVLADSIALAEHYLAFGHGYTMWMDTAVGLMTLALPVLVFELLNDAGRQPRLIGDHDRKNWAMGTPSRGAGSTMRCYPLRRASVEHGR
jgi:hypothetical protein